ncbi:hypothetical protein HOY80DRAFT_97007 [Tuber brumale]|nr:hypothetical protein HOY80DRAFT_97007 [Tuber brumale]
MASGDGWACTSNTPSNQDISSSRIGVRSCHLPSLSVAVAIAKKLTIEEWTIGNISIPNTSDPLQPHDLVHVRSHLFHHFPSPTSSPPLARTKIHSPPPHPPPNAGSDIPVYHSVIVSNISWTSSLTHYLAILSTFLTFSPTPEAVGGEVVEPWVQARNTQHKTRRNNRLLSLAHILLRKNIHTRVCTRWREESFATRHTCCISREGGEHYFARPGRSRRILGMEYVRL